MKYQIFQHPCSTWTAIYLIPTDFLPLMISDNHFKIGVYGTDFCEYLNFGYIYQIGEIELENIPFESEKILTKAKNIDIFYYELPSSYAETLGIKNAPVMNVLNHMSQVNDSKRKKYEELLDNR
jgi:hypothetical protein